MNSFQLQIWLTFLVSPLVPLPKIADFFLRANMLKLWENIYF